MSAPATVITADSILGRVLIALRAGPMSSAELNERIGNYPRTGDLERWGYVTRNDEQWRITDAGRAACPLRNPLAASQPRPATGMQSARSSAAIGLPAKTANPKPLPRPEATETTGGIRMPNPARIHTPTAVDLLRRMLIDAPQGVARKVMIKHTGLAPHAVDNAIINLIKGGEAERKGYGIIAAIPPGINVMAGRLAQSDVIAVASTPTAAGAPEPKDPRGKSRAEAAHRAAAATDTPSPDVDFAIYEDGRLAISSGDEIVVLPPNDTRRLCRFLDRQQRLDAAASPSQSLAA